ncbi:hypothetical protein K470DRAFT_229741, partial [Piedraia hortae CBS 480.64]
MNAASQGSACKAKNGIRLFHSTTAKFGRRRPAFPSVKMAELEAQAAENARVDRLSQHLKPYTEEEKKALSQRYTPAQMEAIEAGEKAVSARDMIAQGRLRGDAFRPTYIDDFATRRPVVDWPDPNEKPRPQKGRGQLLPNVEYGSEADSYQRLSQMTGMSLDEIKNIRVKNVVCHRVANQTHMGKIRQMYFLSIAGNQNGMVGIGEGKAQEMTDGHRQATINAIRNMRPVARYESRTVYGQPEAKVSGTVVQLFARPPGFGIRCQPLIFELARAAGITDLAARTPRSRNKMNVVKAALKALTDQRLPEDVARSRGRKMVDVRRVYYAGAV